MDILEIFRRLTEIPHCSGKTEQMREFICQWGESLGYWVEVDRAGNILARRVEEPNVALQSHYDMVCAGRAPEIQLVEEGGWLKGVDSSIGADNGIGVAAMLKLMESHPEVEYLFTNDEEIGLIGARNLELELRTRYLINLDSTGELLIGAAGGRVLKVEFPVEWEKGRGTPGVLKLEGFPGGHSGVDIDKPIPNGILELASLLLSIERPLLHFKGGISSNAIPPAAEAQLLSPVGEETHRQFKNWREYLQFLLSIPNGVLKFDDRYQIPAQSSNLGVVEDGQIELFYRGNSWEDLEELEQLFHEKLKGVGYQVVEEVAPWPPREGELAQLAAQIFNLPCQVVHAGLECGVLVEKFPELEVISIGPKIENLHSTRERVQIESVYHFFKKLEELLSALQNRN